MALLYRIRGRAGEDRDEHPEQVRDRCARGGHTLPEARGGEAGPDDGSAAVDEPLHDGRERVHVVERQARVEDVGARELQHAPDVLPPPGELRLRAAHAFRRPCRAGRVEQGRGLSGPNGPRRHVISVARERLAARPAPASGGRTADRPDAVELGWEIGHRGEGVEQLPVDRQQPRRRVHEDVLELRPARRRIDGHGDRAEPRRAEEHGEQLPRVLGHDGDPIAGDDARLPRVRPRARPRHCAALRTSGCGRRCRGTGCRRAARRGARATPGSSSAPAPAAAAGDHGASRGLSQPARRARATARPRCRVRHRPETTRSAPARAACGSRRCPQARRSGASVWYRPGRSAPLRPLLDHPVAHELDAEIPAPAGRAGEPVGKRCTPALGAYLYGYARHDAGASRTAAPAQAP